MKRFVDLVFGIIFFIVLIPIFLIVGIVIRVTDPGPVFFNQKRIGKEKKEFYMLKFRTMKVDTPNVATHLLKNPDQYITVIGKVLRKTSLDELPQLINIIRGDMSFVGPRPALYNQYDLIELREKYNINSTRPGLTGWAQVNGRDELEIPEKVKYDKYYIENINIFLDIKIVFLTFLKVVKREGIKQ